MTARDANPWETSDECRSPSTCQACNGYAGGYDTWICRCHTREDRSEP